MIALRLIQQLSFSHWKRDWLKTILSILGIALGIAVFFSVQTALRNVWESFQFSTSIVAPNERLRLDGSTGEIPESLIPEILSLPGIDSVSPQMSRYVAVESTAPPIGSVLVLGVDFLAGQAQDKAFRPELLSKDRQVLISPTLNERIKSKDLTLLINGQQETVQIGGELARSGLAEAYGGNIIVCDIATFQDLFKVWGRVDSLYIEPTPDFSPAKLRSALEARFNSRIRLAERDENLRYAKKMSESFRLNLSFLSGISLFVALFLIYNLVSYQTLKRQPELSLLRSLGASKREIFIFLSAENTLLGFLGSLAGIALGYLFAQVTVGLVSASFSTLYLPIEVREISVTPTLIFCCIFLGPLLCFIGGCLPIKEVLERPPRETAHFEQQESRFHLRVRGLAAIGASLLLSAAGTAQTQILSYGLYLGFLSPALLLVGTVCLVPFILAHFTRFILHFRFFQRAEILLALDHVQSSLKRSSMTVSAIVIATGMYIGLSIMILSFRQTVHDWIEHITEADLYISNQSNVTGPSAGFLANELVDYLVSQKEVVDFDWISSTKLVFADREVRVNGMRYESLVKHDRLLLKLPMNSETFAQTLAQAGTVLVSEPFANRLKISIGDRFHIPGIDGSEEVQVGNIFYDYSSDQGVLLIPDRMFQRLFNEPRKQGVSLYLVPGTDENMLREKILQAFPTTKLQVRSNRMLRQEVLQVFDETFQLTYALQAIALLVSTLTMLNSVLMLMIERAREFTVLRAIGASRISISLMTGFETLYLGLLALILSLFLGLGLSSILVFVVNEFFFGWSVRFVFPIELLTGTAIAVLVLATLCGVLPAYLGTKRLKAEQLSYA